MRIQIYIIAVLVSLIGWGLFYDGMRDAYRAAVHADLLPRMELRKHLDVLFGDIRRLA